MYTRDNHSFTLLAILLATASIAVTPLASAAPTWAQTFGVDPGAVAADFQGDYPRSIVRMPDGGAVVGGYLFVPESEIQNNVTYKVILGQSAIVRYAADGTILWQKVLGPFSMGGSFRTPMVADAAGNIYVASGRFDGTPYVAKFSANGTLLWATKVKLPGKPDPNQGNATPYLNDLATGIILTSDGKVAVGGSYNPGGGGGHSTPYLAELSTAGQVLGAQYFENAHVQYSDVQALAAGPNGKILFVTRSTVDGSNYGNTFVLVDKDGKTVVERAYTSGTFTELPAAINGTSDGGFIEVAVVGRFGAATIIRKLKADLTRQWEKVIQVDGGYYGASAEQTADGGYLIGARGNSASTTTEKALLTKLDAKGVVQKIFAIGSNGFGETGSPNVAVPVYPCVATVTTDGGYAIAGPDAGDWWIAKTDLTGKVRNYKGFMKDVTAEFKQSDYAQGIVLTTDFVAMTATTENAGSPQLEISDPATARVSIQASPPRITSARTAEAVVGQHFAYHIAASFFDAGAAISYSATGLPQGFVFDTTTGVITCVPATGSETASPILITLKATDGSFSTAPVTLALTIGDGVPVLTVVDSGIPSGASVGDRVLSFAATYPGKQAGRNVFIEVNEAGTWHPLPNGMDGHMTYDVFQGRYVLNSTNYPLAGSVSFRARVTVSGHDAAILSNQVGPMNLAGSKQRAGQTVFHLIRNGIRGDLDFIAEQTTAVQGVALRVQSSANPSDEGSWADINTSAGAGMTATGQNRFSLLVNQYKAAEGIYFRVVASGSGFTDSLSNIVGPYTTQSSRPPKVTLKLPAPSGSNTGDAAHPVVIDADNTGLATFTIDAQATATGRTLESISVLFDGNIIHTLTPAPGTISTDYQTSYQGAIGPHTIEVVAIDDLGATARAGSNPLWINIFPATNAARPASATDGTRTAAIFNSSKVFTVAASGGSWNDSSTWQDQFGNPGVPDTADFVILGSSTVHIGVDGELANVGSLSINGGHVVGPGTLQVYTTLAIGAGSFDASVHLIIKPHAVCEMTNSSDFHIDGLLDNHGTLNLHGARGLVGLSQVLNTGSIIFQDPLVASASVAAGLPLDPRSVTSASIFSSGKALTSGVLTRSVVSNDGNSVVGNDGNSLLNKVRVALITNDGGTLVRPGTGSLVSENGAGVLSDHGLGVVSDDGASLITNDGGTLITNDGGTLITNDGGTLVGNSGGTLRGNSPGPALRNFTVEAETTSSGFTQSGGETDLTGINIVGPVTLNGGVLSGSGLIIGNLTNNAGYVSPGHSSGSLLVSGNYKQAAGGTMVLEASGGEAGQFDKVLVGGTASLNGRLDLRTIGGYVPLSADPFNPLGYKAVTGSFSSISSNAQVAQNSTGLVTTINPGAPNPPAGQPLNIATRMSVQTGDNVLIAGFIVTGPSGSTKKVLIRGLGPSLAQFGVANTLSDPLLELHKPGATVTNDNWQQGNTSLIPAGFSPSDPKESVIVATLTPGNYSAVVKGAHGETGIGIAELYDLDSASSAKLANISTRGFINTGDDVMIGGFIIGGTEPAKILVRAIGPTLSDFGVPGALQDPTLELHDSNGATISNNDWRETQESEIIATTIPPSKDREPAILATLAPGNYTAVVRGKNNTTGVGLVEAYNLQ